MCGCMCVVVYVSLCVCSIDVLCMWFCVHGVVGLMVHLVRCICVSLVMYMVVSMCCCVRVVVNMMSYI